jgi:hypothetical protein
MKSISVLQGNGDAVPSTSCQSGLPQIRYHAPGVPGASIFRNKWEYQVTIRLTVGEVSRILTKELLVSCVSVYNNVDNHHCE